MENKDFENIVSPVMKWLAENKNPHTTIIINSECAELVQGVQTVITDKFFVD